MKNLEDLVPGGAHTYSRAKNQFPPNAPKMVVKSKGCYAFGSDGRRYLDWGMGLRSVSIGHADESINMAVIKALSNGINHTMASPIEHELAEEIINLIPCAEMVKFCKNGSDATTAATRLARAVTGKDIILKCKQSSFLSVDDWFIGMTSYSNGVPPMVQNFTKDFEFNDITSFQTIIDQYQGKIACVIMELASIEHPAPEFLSQLREITKRERIVLIFDEIITGFRWCCRGAQHYYGVTPDLACFGKAIANGYSFACLAGKKELMQFGNTDRRDVEKVFLLSSTYGAETPGLVAALATIKKLKNCLTIKGNWLKGARLKEGANQIFSQSEYSGRIEMRGIDVMPYMHFGFDDETNKVLKTAFNYSLVENGVLMPYISISASHSDAEIDKTLNAFGRALDYMSELGLKNMKEKFSSCAIQPVFRSL